MTMTRMFLIFSALFILAALPLAQKPSRDYFVYVGSYTGAPSTSKGIYTWKFKPVSGALTAVGMTAETPNPAHVWVAPNGKYLYAVNWQGSDTIKGDTVSAYAIAADTGALTFLNKAGSGGVQPNQVVVDPTGKIAVTVNYNSGTMAALAVGANGKLG